ncbi:MAG TPA: hypothetical protein VF722_07095 [Gemmatimonadaceae bacterium]
MHIPRTTAAAMAAGLLALATVGARAQDSTRTPPPPKVKTPSLDFSGVVFGNFDIETDDATKAANGGHSTNKFDIERAYLTFKMPAGSRASVRVTTDIKPGTSASGYQGWFVRLKYGYLEYNYLKPTATGVSGYARIGILTTVLIDHEESFWPRYLSKTAVEKAGFFSSADVGAAGQLSLPNKMGELYATITNGNGYESPETNRFKDVALRVSLTPLAKTPGFLQSLTISPWAYLGQNASKFATDTTDPIGDGLKRNRYGVFAGVKDPRLTLGAEWAERTDASEGGSTPLTRTVTTTTGRLLDGFAIVRPFRFSADAASMPSIGLVARYDHFTPDDAAAGYQENWIGGVFWEPTPQTALALDYQRTTPKGGLSGAVSEIWYLHWQVTF